MQGGRNAATTSGSSTNCGGGGGRHSRSSSSSRRHEGDGGGGGVMRKGPWMAEEDEVLMEYVRRNGPRDWSSIRSKGLLPRTGKSCRLRWVNKLNPDLKTGCKFTPEEERIVIEFQAQFGNKWARIATYLPGRTDNDVKNFWSTRQKRLARILRTPSPSKSSKHPGKLPSSSNEAPNSEDCFLDLILFGEDSAIDGQCSKLSCMVDQDDMKMMPQMPDLPRLPNLDAALPLLDSANERYPYFLHSLPPPPPPLSAQLQLAFDGVPPHGFPLLPEGSDLFLPPRIGEMSFPDCQEPPPFMELSPDSFFDDFPSDMFDYLEPPPPPPATSSASR